MNKTVIGLLLCCVNSVLIGLRCVFDVLNARYELRLTNDTNGQTRFNPNTNVCDGVLYTLHGKYILAIKIIICGLGEQYIRRY